MSEDNQKENTETILKTPVMDTVPTVKKEAVTETRTCLDCQGDGVWDGVVCATCLGSGKIFKDGTVVLVGGTKQALVANKGELKV